MRRTWLAATTLALALPLLAVPLSAANSASPAKAVGAPVPLLWKVSDKDNSVYLLGSFHMLREDDYPLSKDVDNAFADAEEVVFELSPQEMVSTELGTKMAMAALRSDGTGLDSDLPPALAAKLAAWSTKNADSLKRAGMTPETLQRLEPWFVGLLVTIIEGRNAGFTSENGMDVRLGKQATEAGKRTAGLETGLQQMAMLDGMTKSEQVQMLEESLDEKEGGRDALQRLHAQWRAGDPAVLWKELGVEFRDEYPALYKRINADRNAAWVPEIARRLDTAGTDDTLVVVGTLHLLGKDGVVERLKAKGYKVERVCSACKR
jgi:uncharacterized protein YbaP (TraB family)